MSGSTIVAPDAILRQCAHRPFPLPQAPWVMRQSWSQLLFAHWPVQSVVMRELVPAAFDLDLYDGFAWLGVVPFAMRHVSPRFCPEFGPMSNFLELNVRTYVTYRTVPGVYFFSLDCSNPLAVQVARGLFHLPYFDAAMSMSVLNSGVVDYSSARSASAAGDGALQGKQRVAFAGRYRASGPAAGSTAGSIEHFLTERYCLYTADRRGNPYRGVVHHLPWQLQPAEAEISACTMTEHLGFPLGGAPQLLHYSENIDTLEWLLERLS